MKSEEKTEIFTTEGGAIAIDSPTKKQILHSLSLDDKTVKQISEEIGKAKSTTSVHLSDLAELGLIEENESEEDARKKIYSLEADFFGESTPPTSKQYRHILENLEKSSTDKYEFLKNLFHLIRYGFDSQGVNVAPALKSIGRDAGKSLTENFDSETLDGLKKEIKEFWEATSLGEVEFENNSIIVHDCFDCGGMPDIGSTICSLDEGILEGIIMEKTGRKISIKEEECHAVGEDHCKFRIKGLEDEKRDN